MDGAEEFAPPPAAPSVKGPPRLSEMSPPLPGVKVWLTINAPLSIDIELAEIATAPPLPPVVVLKIAALLFRVTVFAEIAIGPPMPTSLAAVCRRALLVR